MTYICSCFLAVLRKELPPPLARALPGSTNFVGTSTQAHLLVMSVKHYTLYCTKAVLQQNYGEPSSSKLLKFGEPC